MRKTIRAITPQNVHTVISEHMLADVFPFVFDLERSHGNHLFDSKSGKTYLDGFSFIASNPIGFNHPRLNDPVFERSLLKAAKVKPSNSDLYSVEMGEFIETFYALALPAEFKHLFFIDGGTLAVENALKAAFDWKMRKNGASGVGETVGSQVIHFREAFHGRSGYTLSLTNTADPRKVKLFPKFSWPRIVNPKCRFPLTGENLSAVITAEKEAEAAIRSVCDSSGDDIAALIIEPIQGEGGDNHFRPEFHAVLRALADAYEFMLIYDEVQTGVGLTGKMWAYEHYGIVPDMITFGKKMQVCGFMCTDRIDSVANNVFQEKSRINSTWGGNLVDMVRAKRFLEIIDEEQLISNAQVVGAQMLDGISTLQNESGGLASNARGKGLMCAFDLPSTEKRDQMVTVVRENGAIILPCGTVSVRLRPSLTFGASELAELLDILRKSLRSL